MNQGEALAKLRQTIRKQNREPNDLEIKQFAGYNLGLYEKALKMIQSEQEKNPHNLKLRMS
jgi:hypothetical protein